MVPLLDRSPHGDITTPQCKLPLLSYWFLVIGILMLIQVRLAEVSELCNHIML